MDDRERRIVALHEAVSEALRRVVDDVEFATRGEPVALEEQVRRVLTRMASQGDAEEKTATQRFRPPKSDRGLERARLRAVLAALEKPVSGLRHALFGTSGVPFPSWVQAVAWIESERVPADEVQAIEARDKVAYEVLLDAFDQYCDANPFVVRDVSTRLNRLNYLDAEGNARATLTKFGSPLHRLQERCRVWSGVTWISGVELLRLVLIGEKPTRLNSLLVSRGTEIPSVPPLDPQLVKRFVTVQVDVRDVTHRTFIEAFKRTRDFRGLGKRRKAARDERGAELRETVARLGGPSAPGIWKNVCREIPRLRKRTPDAARKAYTRLLKTDGREPSTHPRGRS